jgi:hypothetical protein
VCRDANVPNFADSFHNSKTIDQILQRTPDRTILRRDPDPPLAEARCGRANLSVLLARWIVARRECKHHRESQVKKLPTPRPSPEARTNEDCIELSAQLQLELR